MLVERVCGEDQVTHIMLRVLNGETLRMPHPTKRHSCSNCVGSIAGEVFNWETDDSTLILMTSTVVSKSSSKADKSKVQIQL